MALFSELPNAFPFYERKEHQNRFRQSIAGRPDLPGGYLPIDLLCPYDAILPFEFYVNTNISPIKWGLYLAADDSFVQDFDVLMLDRTWLAGVHRRYIYHDGRFQNMQLPVGEYYCRIDFAGNIHRYSEIFHVCKFSVLQVDCPYLKLQWWNDADLNPLFYNDKVGNVPRFTNVVYLDTFIHIYEPEIVQETEPGGQGGTVVTFTRANLRYRIAVCVPEYLKKALVLIQVHDHVILTTTGYDGRTGEIENISTSTEAIFNGVFSNLEILFQDTFMTKTSCPDNMT